MKKAFFLIGLAGLGAGAPLPAAPTGQHATAPAIAPAGAERSAPATVPTAEELATSRAAVASADIQRLFSDRAYAAAILVHLDRLAAALDANSEASLAIGSMRLVALITQERPDDIRAGIDAMLAQRPTDGRFYAGPWISALAIRDFDRAVAVAEAASRNVAGVHWADLRGIFEPDQIGLVLRQLRSAHREAERVRLAEAMFRIGWTGGAAELADSIRSILVEDRLRQHDDGAAADFAAGITTPSHVLAMLVQTRFDPIFPSGRDRLELLHESLERRDRVTADALAAAPQDLHAALDRVLYLRSMSRDADALVLVMPFTRDVPATVAANRDGMWLINEGASALLRLGRNDEAVALMRRLLALPIAQNVPLIGPFIDFAEILNAAGRHAEALDHVQMLERDDVRYANDFGKMWIAAARVCALAGLNRTAEAAPALEHMRMQSEVNPAALTRAYLCAGDDDAAAALIVHSLQSDDPEEAVVALQNYTLSPGTGREGMLLNRLAVLRERPAVRDALARVGHVLTIPLPRTYWGGF